MKEQRERESETETERERKRILSSIESGTNNACLIGDLLETWWPQERYSTSMYTTLHHKMDSTRMSTETLLMMSSKIRQI